MKLGTHEERIAALESAADTVANAIELATLVQLANQLVREDEYRPSGNGLLTSAGYADMCAQQQKAAQA